MLLGRAAELAAFAEIVNSARDGRSSVLVLRGEPGVGKTSLLEAAVDGANGCQILRAAGFESEGPAAFAGLYQLCKPILDQRARLPAPQRNALDAAFGLEAGEPPNRFLVGLAVLGMLSEAGTQGAVLIVVDDAQWLDAESAQTLAFVARRLEAESVAVLVSVREPADADPFAGLPDLRVGGLTDE